MSIGQKILSILIFSALFGLKGILVAITTYTEDKEVSNTLIELSSALLTNVIFISLLVFTKIFG